MSSRREEVAQRKPFKRVFSGLFRKQKGCGPFEITGVPDLQCPPSRASSTYFGSTLFLVCTALLVCKMSDDLPAEQQIWKTCPPQGIFALQKSLRGGLQWGTGDLIAENAAPLFGKESRGNPFQGFPLGNFFLTADAVLLCAAKKNGVGTRTSWHVTPEAHWPYLATAGNNKIRAPLSA